MAGVGADNPDATMASDYLAVVTNFLDARSDLHRTQSQASLIWGIGIWGNYGCGSAGAGPRGLLIAVSDSSALQVVGGQLNLDTIAGQNTDVMHAHFSGDMGQHLVAVFELDAEHCIGQ